MAVGGGAGKSVDELPSSPRRGPSTVARLAVTVRVRLGASLGECLGDPQGGDDHDPAVPMGLGTVGRVPASWVNVQLP
jgi:hypothetical protein